MALLALFGGVALYMIWFFFGPGKSKGGLWNEFATDYGIWLFGYSIVVAFLPAVIERTSLEYEDERLRRQQKERMKLLTEFTPRDGLARLLGVDSIYRCIVDVLERFCQAVEQGPATARSEVRMLLCSPALDYPGRAPYDEWGTEFLTTLDDLATKRGVKVDMTLLPAEPLSGFHYSDDFIAILADYCAKHEAERTTPRTVAPLDAETIFGHIKARDTDIRGSLGGVGRLQHVQMREMANIPFQIVLTMAGARQEVVVSFAGREILEDRNTEPKGFHSSDPHVVKTFAEIYEDYVTPKRRLPLAPRHTRNVIQAHRLDSGLYTLGNYLDLGFDLKVCDGSFSPLFGNSSKFTSWVLSKVMTGAESVLDIGSGTGVQALVARAVQKKGNGSPTVVAVEPIGDAFENLLVNCPAGSGVTAYQYWLVVEDENGQLKLSSEVKDEGTIERACLAQLDGKAYTKVTLDQEFDLVVADLPFCDAKPEDEPDRAFFDLGHREHRALFKALTGAGPNGIRWKQGGRLVTSFSTLGGPEDVARFEKLIADNHLAVLQRHCFNEADFMWMVYVLTRRSDFDSTAAAADYWREELQVKKAAVQPEPSADTG
jgi:hypothetical protein